MVEITTTKLAGLIVTVIVLASGSTYYLQETGKYTNCSGGWILNGLTGKYECTTRDVEPHWCHHLSPSKYRCYIGIPVDVDETIKTVKIYANNKMWDCETKNGEIHSYSRCYSDNYEAYIGELV